MIVLGLPNETTDEDLEKHFSRFGKLEACEVRPMILFNFRVLALKSIYALAIFRLYSFLLVKTAIYSAKTGLCKKKQPSNELFFSS